MDKLLTGLLISGPVHIIWDECGTPIGFMHIDLPTPTPKEQ
jgi:hypothetical protein